MLSKKRIVLIVSVLFISVVLVLAFNGKQQTREYTPVTYNLQNSWVSRDSVYFYTGSFFARYDTKNDSVERISDYLIINNGINSVNWTRDAVVFQTDPTESDRDDITTAAAIVSQKPDSSHWWRYDFTQKQYQLLSPKYFDNCTTVIQISARGLACSEPQSLGSESSRLKTFDIQDATSVKLLESDDLISDLSAKDDNLYFIVTNLSNKQSLKSVSLSTKKLTNIYEDGNSIGYVIDKDGSVLIDDSLTSESDHSHDEETVDKVDQKLSFFKDGQIVFDKNINSPALDLYIDERGLPSYSSAEGIVGHVDSDGLHQQIEATKGDLVDGDLLFKIGDKLYVIDTDLTLLSSPSTNHTFEYKRYSSFEAKNDNDTSGNSFIEDFKDGSSSAYIYLDNTDSSRQQEALGDYLINRGFWPSEFDLNWVVDGADFNAPIVPKVTLVE